jgi:hypothetical protein
VPVGKRGSGNPRASGRWACTRLGA